MFAIIRGQNSHCQVEDYEKSFLQTGRVRLFTVRWGRAQGATNVEQEMEKRASFVRQPCRLRLFGIRRNFFAGRGGLGGGGGGGVNQAQHKLSCLSVISLATQSHTDCQEHCD